MHTLCHAQDPIKQGTKRTASAANNAGPKKTLTSHFFFFFLPFFSFLFGRRDSNYKVVQKKSEYSNFTLSKRLDSRAEIDEDKT